MFRKSACLMLVLSFLLIAACSNKGKETNGSSNAPAGTPTATSSSPVGMDTPKDTPIPNPNAPGKEVDAAAPEASLPVDVPAYPGAQLVDKRTTGEIYKFVYRTTDNATKVKEYFLNELKNQQWSQQYASSSDGLLFTKAGRSIKITPIPMGNQGTQFFIFAGMPTQLDQAKDKQKTMEEQAKIEVGNLVDVLKYEDDIPKDVPVYPNAEPKPTTKTQMIRKWREFDIKDSVKTVASWYDDKLIANGWANYHDTSEDGDSMKIYNKDDGKGGTRFVGIRVNDMKSFRHLTLVLYPEGVFIPKLKSPKQLAKQQPETVKQVEEAQRQAKEFAEKKSRENQAKEKEKEKAKQ